MTGGSAIRDGVPGKSTLGGGLLCVPGGGGCIVTRCGGIPGGWDCRGASRGGRLGVNGRMGASRGGKLGVGGWADAIGGGGGSPGEEAELRVWLPAVLIADP